MMIASKHVFNELGSHDKIVSLFHICHEMCFSENYQYLRVTFTYEFFNIDSSGISPVMK